MWDARLLLWDKLCTCGGRSAFPDVRMCRCLAPHEAGLTCQGCSSGVMLIKGTPREQGGHGLFLGCSMYKKLGCKHTLDYGSPHDKTAQAELKRLEGSLKRKTQAEEEERASIVDPHEIDWRAVCRCEGAKQLDTMECYMQSNKGCGMLALCPGDCHGAGCLFLCDGKYGRYWQCSLRNKSGCTYRNSYKEHAAPKKKKPKPSTPTFAEIHASKDSFKPIAVEMTSSKAMPSVSTPQPLTIAKKASSPAPKNDGDEVLVRETLAATTTTSPRAAVHPTVVAVAHTGLNIDNDKENNDAPSVNVRYPVGQESTTPTKTTPPNAVTPISNSIGGGICKVPANDALHCVFLELSNIYFQQGNYNAGATYRRVCDAIYLLDYVVTVANAKLLCKGKTKVPGVGKASSDKMFEFLTTGSIAKLQEKKSMRATTRAPLRDR